MLSDAEATGGIVIEDMAVDLLYYMTAEEVAALEAEAEPDVPSGPAAPTGGSREQSS